MTISGSVLEVDSVMVELAGRLKSTSEPAQALACPMAQRNVPEEPLSAVLVTRYAAGVHCAAARGANADADRTSAAAIVRRIAVRMLLLDEIMRPIRYGGKSGDWRSREWKKSTADYSRRSQDRYSPRARM